MHHRLILLPLIALLCAGAPAVAQPLANGALVEERMFDGAVVFRGDGSITDHGGEGGAQTFRFWRPILFPHEPWPIAGRMDCDVSARGISYTADLFDLQARYEAVKKQRDEAGLRDEDVVTNYTDDIRRLDVSGRRARPVQPFVLSYIVMRDDNWLYDIRMNCTFAQGEDASSKHNFAALVHAYTSFSLEKAQTISAGENNS